MDNKDRDNYLKQELYQLIQTDQTMFDFIQESSLDGLWYWDLEDMENEWMNAKFWTTLGYNPEEMPHKSSAWKDLINQDDLKLAIENLKKQMDNPDHPYDQIVRYRHKNGSTVWIRCRGLIVRDEKGKPIRMVGAHQDITFLKETEIKLQKKSDELSANNDKMQAMNEELVNLNDELELSNKQLHVSEENWSSLFQNMKEHVVLHELVFDEHGTPVNYRILECNRRFTEVTGISAEQAVGKLATQVYGTTTPPYLEVYASVAINGTPHYFETFFPPMDKYFSVSAVSTGKNRFATITSDITEQKQRQFETERLKEQYELAVAGSNDGIWDWNILTNELFLSKRWKEMLGYEDWEIKNEFDSFISLLYDEDIPRVNDFIQSYLKGETEQYTMEFRMKHKNGALVWILAKGEALRDENGNPYRMAGSHSDITERKEMEEQLIHAKDQAEAGNKAKSLFLANMSHELRTPLNGIIGFSDILRTTPLEDEQKGFLDIVLSSAKHLTGIISDVLDLSRIEAGKLELSPEKTDLRKLIDDTCAITWFKAEEKGLFLTHSVENNVPENVTVDGPKLRQILVNLLTNAVKFSDEGTVVLTVSLLERQGDKARLLFKVIDTGMGIKEKDRARIFDPFHQANMSTSKKAQGAGLGLSIVTNLLEKMGSVLEFKSTFGEGSTFYFELLTPVERQQPKELNRTNTERKVEVKSFKGKKILIAEDNPVNMRYAQTALSMFSKDIQIITAENGKEAYKQYLEHTPNLILMDIIMPSVDGYQATKMIRQCDTQIPIIAMTAKALSEDKEDCLAAGMSDYIAKPVTLDELKEVLKKHL